MTIEQVEQIIKYGEGINIEFKEARNGIPSSFYDTVVSFANTDGGIILLGIDDGGNITGIDPKDIHSMKKDIISTANSPDKINPPIILNPIIVAHEKGLILYVEIGQSKSVHQHQNVFFIRRNESDINISRNQDQISELFIRNREIHTENKIYCYLTFDDFEMSLFEKARNLIRSHQNDHPWLTLSNEELLKRANLWCHDNQTNKEGYTFAAALLFGKETTIQNINPAYKIDALVRIENKDRFDDRLILRKNLIESYIELRQFLDRHLPNKFFLEGDQRIDLRDRIFREVVGNIIVHREYSSTMATELIITENDVTTKNPNIPKFHGPINLNSFTPVSKNPNIRKFFMALGWADELGSGIRNTSRYLPYYVPNAKPTFIEEEVFTTIIPLAWVSMQKYASSFLEWLDLPQESLTHIEEGLKDISLPNEFKNSSWDDILLYLIPSWTKIGKKINTLRWSLNQQLEKDLKKKIPSLGEKDTKLEPDFMALTKTLIQEYQKKIPSLDKKDTNLLSKRSYTLIKVLFLTVCPIKLQTLLEWNRYSFRKKFNDLYMQPLINIEFLSRTMPDKPNDPEQKYILTEKGKLFLSGQL